MRWLENHHLFINVADSSKYLTLNFQPLVAGSNLRLLRNKLNSTNFYFEICQIFGDLTLHGNKISRQHRFIGRLGLKDVAKDTFLRGILYVQEDATYRENATVKPNFSKK